MAWDSGKQTDLFKHIFILLGKILQSSQEYGMKMERGRHQAHCSWCTIRGVVSQIYIKHVLPVLTNRIQPTQLGFGLKRGRKAAVLRAGKYLTNDGREVLDVKNALNSVD